MAPNKDQKKTKRLAFRRFYELFKSDLSLNEIERLIKQDVPGVYDFYAREMEKPDKKQNKILHAFTFARNFFVAFLLKLTAARRLFYSIALFLFFLWTVHRNG